MFFEKNEAGEGGPAVFFVTGRLSRLGQSTNGKAVRMAADRLFHFFFISCSQ